MWKISPFDAPALLGAHPNITPLDLYQRMTGEAKAPSTSAPGLNAKLTPVIAEYAAETYGFKLGQRDTVFREDGLAGYWPAEDDKGKFALLPLILDDFQMRDWRRTGVPPKDRRIGAHWVMLLSGRTRVAYAVQCGRQLVRYDVDVDPAMLAQIDAAYAEMRRRVADKDPPALDAAPPAPIEAPVAELPGATEDLATEWCALRASRSRLLDELDPLERRLEKLNETLKSRLKPGETAGRVTHHAKKKCLIEEPEHDAYF